MINTWKMWAYKYPNCYMHFGCYQYVKIHHLPQPMVEVELKECQDGSYYGWVENDVLLGGLTWPSNHQMEMCFPYGSKIQEDRGKGRKVRLSVKEINDEN